MKRRLVSIIILLSSILFAQPNWEPVTGLFGSNIYRTIFNSNDVVFTYVINGGMWRSSNLGADWFQINYGFQNADVISLAIDNEDILYAGTDGYGVYKSIDDGNSWQQTLNLNTKFTAIGTGNSVIFVGSIYGLVHKSLDNGENWETVLDTNMITNINDILVTNSGITYVACNDKQIFISSDYGVTWTKTTVGLNPANNVTSMIVNSNGSVFAGLDHGGLLISNDNGQSWKYSNNGLPENSSVKLLNIDSNGKLFAILSSNAVYTSTDNGTNWVLFDDGLGAFTINTIASSSNGVTIIGTVGGMYKSQSSVSGIGDNELSYKYELKQNYPNPFNPSTKISYSLAKEGFITIKIFDAIGREIKTLVQENKNAGSYIIDLDASNLSSGIYYYQLTSGHFTSTQKMLLIK